MLTFVGNEMIQINSEIPINQKIHIFVIYDESLFYANDDHPIV